MFVGKDGVAIRVEGGLETSSETVSRLKDLIILQLNHKGLSFADIGRVLNLPKGTVYYRYRTIPPDARKYYEKQIRRLA